MLSMVVNGITAFVAGFVAFHFADSPIIAVLVFIGAFVALRFVAALAVTGTLLFLVNRPD